MSEFYTATEVKLLIFFCFKNHSSLKKIMASVVANMVAGRAGGGIGGKVLGKIVGDKLGGTKQSRPPPVVWFLKLRREPINGKFLHEEDKPEIKQCERICIKILVIPPSFMLYLFGLMIWSFLACFSACFYPALGPAFHNAFKDMVKKRLKGKITTNDGSEIDEKTMAPTMGELVCCGKCLISTMWFATRRCIYPFWAFWTWGDKTTA